MNTVENKGIDLKMENVFRANQEQSKTYRTTRSCGKKLLESQTFKRRMKSEKCLSWEGPVLAGH